MLTAPLGRQQISTVRSSLVAIIGCKHRLSFAQLTHLADLCEEVDPALISTIGLSTTKLRQVGKVRRCPTELEAEVNNLLTIVTSQPRRQRGVPNTKSQKRKLRLLKQEQRQLRSMALAAA